MAHLDLPQVFAQSRSMIEKLFPSKPAVSGFDLMCTRRKKPKASTVERLRVRKEWDDANFKRANEAYRQVSMRPIRIPMQVKSA